jgi:uncharacterized coiled-coil protein SlyX
MDSNNEQQTIDSINAILDRVEARMDRMNEKLERIGEELDKLLDGKSKYDNDKSRDKRMTTTYDGEIMFRYKNNDNE